jgi:hypothetical protein
VRSTLDGLLDCRFPLRRLMLLGSGACWLHQGHDNKIENHCFNVLVLTELLALAAAGAACYLRGAHSRGCAGAQAAAAGCRHAQGPSPAASAAGVGHSLCQGAHSAACDGEHPGQIQHNAMQLS